MQLRSGGGVGEVGWECHGMWWGGFSVQVLVQIKVIWYYKLEIVLYSFV